MVARLKFNFPDLQKNDVKEEFRTKPRWKGFKDFGPKRKKNHPQKNANCNYTLEV